MIPPALESQLPAIADTLKGPLASMAEDVVGGLIGDRLARWRVRNVIKAQGKLQRELDAAGLKLNTEKIPERFAFAWFEEVSKQDDDTLQDLFAKLMARAGSGEIGADDRLVRVLGNLTPDEARVFEHLYSPGAIPPHLWSSQGGIQRYIYLKQAETLPVQSPKAALDALAAVGLVRQVLARASDEHGFGGMALWRHGSIGGSPEQQLREEAKQLRREIEEAKKQAEYVRTTALGDQLAEAVLAKPAEE